jgi:negative regulator of flagellin synthesis FlgM
MVIDNNNPNLHRARLDATKAATQSVRSAEAAQTTPQPASPANTDSVNLSGTAKNLSRLESQIRGADISQPQKLAALKAAIDSGAYQVDAEAIAQKMLDE